MVRICSLNTPAGLAAWSSPRSSRSNSGRRSPNRWGVELDSEKMLATTSSAVRSTGPPAISIRRRSVKPGGPVDLVLAAGRVGDDAAARAALRPEIAADQGVDLRPGRPGMGEVSVVVDALMGRRVNVDAGPARHQHGADGPGHQVALHPVERLREGHDPEACRARPAAPRPAWSPTARCARPRAAPARAPRRSSPGRHRYRPPAANRSASSRVSEPGPQPTSSNRPVPSRPSSSVSASASESG